MRFTLIVAVVFSILCSAAVAQPLVDHLPGDVIEYIAWKGTDRLAPQYNGSHLKQFLDSSKVQQFLADNIPIWLSKTPKGNDPMVQRIQGEFLDIGKILARHPTVIEVTMDATGKLPHTAVLCDAGKETDDLQSKLDDVISQIGNKQMHMTTVDQLTVVDLMPGPAPQTTAQTSLAVDPTFTASMAQCLKDPAFILYLHPTGAMKQEVPNVDKFLWTSGFDGKNWADQIYYKLDKDTTLPAADPAAVGDLMQSIPATAQYAGAGTVDFAHLIDDIAGFCDNFNTGSGDQLKDTLKQMQFDPQGDLMANLGPALGYYVEPPQVGVFGPGALRMIFLNRPKDMQKVQTAFAGLAPAIPSGLNTVVSARDPNVLMVGPSQTFVKTAAARTSGDSILSNPLFIDLRKKLNAPDKFDSFTFYDLPKSAANEYPILMLLGQQALGQSNFLGQETLGSLLPTPDKLAAALEPSGTFQWTDDLGVHLHAITPFPGSEVLAALGGMVSAAVLRVGRLAAAMRPAFTRSRQTQNAFKGMTNMRDISVQLTLYAKAHQSTLPPDLGTLIKTQDIPMQTFIAPGSATTLPPDAQSMSPDQEADWINANSDYEFISGGASLAKSPATLVTLVQKDSTGTSDTVDVSFADGHVELLPKDKANEAIAATRKQLGK